MKRSFIPSITSTSGGEGFPGIPAIVNARLPATTTTTAIFSRCMKPLEGWIITSHQPIKSTKYVVWASKCTLSPPMSFSKLKSEDCAKNDAPTSWRPCTPITFAAGDTVRISNENNSNNNNMYEIQVIAYTPSSNQADFLLRPLKGGSDVGSDSLFCVDPREVTQHWPGTECNSEEIAMRAISEMDKKNCLSPLSATTILSSSPSSATLPPTSINASQPVKFATGLPAIKPQSYSIPATTSVISSSPQNSSTPLTTSSSQQQQQQVKKQSTMPPLSTASSTVSMGLPFKRPAIFCNYFGFSLPRKSIVCGGLPGIVPDDSGSENNNDEGDVLQSPGVASSSSFLSSSSSSATLQALSPLPSTTPSSAAAMQQGTTNDNGTRGSSNGTVSLNSAFSQKISMTVAQKKGGNLHTSTSPMPPLNPSASLPGIIPPPSMLAASSSQMAPSFPTIVSSTSPSIKDVPLVVSQKQSFFSTGPPEAAAAAVMPLPLAVPPIVSSSDNSDVTTKTTGSSVVTVKKPVDNCCVNNDGDSKAIANFNDIGSLNSSGDIANNGDNKNNNGGDIKEDIPKLVMIFDKYLEAFVKFKNDFANKMKNAGGGGDGLKEFNDLIREHKLEEQHNAISEEISILFQQEKQ